tara:strand:- start:244 stop:942 length:699 start_codon:yes stop_codon:yes gene_type:complete
MNNLVKFLILSFLILWPASLNADSKPSAYIKCDNLECPVCALDASKRELIVNLDVADKYYYALQWIDGSKNIGHFWRGKGSLSLLGDNDQFYVFEDLWLWKGASSEEKLIKALETIPLRADNRLNDAFLSVYFSLPLQNLNTTLGWESPRLNRETLILTYPREELQKLHSTPRYPDKTPPKKDYKCRLIDEKAADAVYEELNVLFEDNWTEALKRNEELEAKKKEQRERYKL